MSIPRDMKLGRLEALRQNLKSLEAQAANSLLIIQMKADGYRKDLSTLDVENLHQAATDLKQAVLLLRENKKLADELSEELYG
jgi:alanine racemase